MKENKPFDLDLNLNLKLELKLKLVAFYERLGLARYLRDQCSSQTL